MTGQSDCEAIPGYLHFGTDTQLRLIQLGGLLTWEGTGKGRFVLYCLSCRVEWEEWVGGSGGHKSHQQQTRNSHPEGIPLHNTSLIRSLLNIGVICLPGEVVE